MDHDAIFEMISIANSELKVQSYRSEDNEGNMVRHQALRSKIDTIKMKDSKKVTRIFLAIMFFLLSVK